MKRNSSGNRTSVYTLEKGKKKRAPNRFLSVPFRKRTTGAYGPFFTKRVKLERAKYRLHVKIHPSRSNFVRNRFIFFSSFKRPFSIPTKKKKLTYFHRKCSAFMNFCVYYSHVLFLSGISRLTTAANQT